MNSVLEELRVDDVDWDSLALACEACLGRIRFFSLEEDPAPAEFVAAWDHCACFNALVLICEQHASNSCKCHGCQNQGFYRVLERL